MDEGEEPGKQVGFSRVMKERGVVKGFSEIRTSKGRVWEGIDVTFDKVDTDVLPAKHGGVVESVSTLEKNELSVPETPRVEDLSENDAKVDMLTQGSSDTFEFDGLGEE